jgi:hypothetical protein
MQNYKSQMKKDKHNLQKNTAQKTKHRATRTTLKKGGVNSEAHTFSQFCF